MRVFMLNQVKRTKSHGSRLFRMCFLDLMSSTAHNILAATRVASRHLHFLRAQFKCWKKKTERAVHILICIEMNLVELNLHRVYGVETSKRWSSLTLCVHIINEHLRSNVFADSVVGTNNNE